jgi:hypothetical protein
LPEKETVYAKDGTKSIKKVADPDKVKSSYKEDGWNDLGGHSQRDRRLFRRLTAWSFPNLPIMMKKYSTSKGWIAFQDHGKGTNVEFKNIRIRIDK